MPLPGINSTVSLPGIVSNLFDCTIWPGFVEIVSEHSASCFAATSCCTYTLAGCAEAVCNEISCALMLPAIAVARSGVSISAAGRLACSTGGATSVGLLSVGFSLEPCRPAAELLICCSSAVVRGVSGCGRLLGGRELPSLTLRSSMEDAMEPMVARGASAPTVPCLLSWTFLAVAKLPSSAALLPGDTHEHFQPFSARRKALLQEADVLALPHIMAWVLMRLQRRTCKWSGMPSALIVKLLLKLHSPPASVVVLCPSLQLG